MSRFHLWIKILIILIVLQSSTGGNLIRQLIPCDDEKAEPFIRSLVVNASQLLPNPVPLPTQSEFVILTDGTVTGLSTLSPNHTTKITCKDDVVEIRAHLNVDAIKAKYKWLRYILTRTLDGVVHLRAKKFEVFIEISQNIDEKKNITCPHLNTCYVNVMEDIDVDVTGREFITWPIDKITSPAILTFENIVRETVESFFKDALVNQLEGVTLAVKS